MDQRDYNSPIGIHRYLASLHGLHALATERRRAFVRRERLSWLCLFGRWTLDTWGNLGILTGAVPAELGIPLPPVVDERELTEALRRRLGAEARVTYTQSADPPTPEVLCPECGRGWSLNDAHDAIRDRDVIHVLLWPNPGQTYSEAAWAGTDPSVGEWKPILPDDPQRLARAEEAGRYILHRWRHRSCHASMLLPEERWRIEDMLDSAGWSDVEVEPIEGRQSGENAPWFRVRHELGDIVIGRRFNERFVIDWSATGRDLSRLFRGVHRLGHPIEHGAHFIRPPDHDHAVQFLSLIREALVPAAAA